MPPFCLSPPLKLLGKPQVKTGYKDIEFKGGRAL